MTAILSLQTINYLRTHFTSGRSCYRPMMTVYPTLFVALETVHKPGLSVRKDPFIESGGPGTRVAQSLAKRLERCELLRRVIYDMSLVILSPHNRVTLAIYHAPPIGRVCVDNIVSFPVVCLLGASHDSS
jgi:hypothetical protein